jgi:dephospho-CoA kinase
MQVVAFTGLPGAGKTDAVEEARRRGLPIVVMGDFVRAEAKRRGLEPVDTNLGAVAQDMRARSGSDVFAQKTADAILARHAKAPLVVVDGVRSLPEIQAFRKRFGQDFQLVAIEAPDVQRFVRLKARGRSDDSQSESQIRHRDEREKAWGLLEAIRNADARIENNRSLEAFRADVSLLFDRLTSLAARGSSTGPARAASGTRP